MFKTIADPADCEVRSVIRFLNRKKVKAAELHLQLVENYGENVMADGMRDFRGRRFDNDDDAKNGVQQWLSSLAAFFFEEGIDKKNKDLKTWRVPSSHDWYKRSSPGGSIGLACDRADQTALSRFVSGHLRSCSFSHGNKVFPVCTKCGVASASPEHILSCLRLSRETFEMDSLLALDFVRMSGLMDGV
ncbi:hypothetical protein AVEN_227091-1 [Araneus ventricosus]|uniref:Mos1 transposase HTH domain-containing protein n=1 Tax=Araneus ventricosus TaxID=182803 RepID=A0A4Y2BXG4_ARAVE|nr:hypothetical protein AVEN_227091-1 [Araneus ventricosus]